MPLHTRAKRFSAKFTRYSFLIACTQHLRLDDLRRRPYPSHLRKLILRCQSNSWFSLSKRCGPFNSKRRTIDPICGRCTGWNTECGPRCGLVVTSHCQPRLPKVFKPDQDSTFPSSPFLSSLPCSPLMAGTLLLFSLLFLIHCCSLYAAPRYRCTTCRQVGTRVARIDATAAGSLCL